MNRHHSQPVNIPEPLSGEVSAELLELDARLARCASTVSAPAGLADRVFASSVAMLPQAVAPAASSPRLRLVPAAAPAAARQVALHRTAWSRMAMAACVVLASMVAFSILRSPSTRSPQPSNGSLALNGSHNPARVSSDTNHAEIWALQMELAHAMPSSHVESKVWHLQETMDMTSDELTSDCMTLLAARF